jgi:hypothetical protein
VRTQKRRYVCRYIRDGEMFAENAAGAPLCGGTLMLGRLGSFSRGKGLDVNDAGFKLKATKVRGGRRWI